MTNSNVNNNTFIATLSQPTNSDGTLKATVWQSKGKALLDAGTIDIIETKTGLIVNGKVINNVTFQVKAMQSVFDGSEKLESFLDYMGDGFTSAMQHNASKGESTKTVKPLHGHVVTSEEYIQGAYKLAAEPTIIESVYCLLSNLKDASTKVELWLAVEAVKALIITPEKFEGYQNLIAKEEARTRFEALYITGFSMVKQFGDTFVSIISATNIAEGINALSASGFELFGSPVLNAVDMTFKVSFKVLNTANNI